MIIRKLGANEVKPLELLLLADPSREHVLDYLQRGDCYITEEADQVVGAYVLLPTRPQAVELVNIAVSEAMQGKGIGKKLISDAIERAEKAGYKTIEVGTGNSSIMQLAFYQKAGFRITGIDRDFFLKNYKEEIFENGIQCVDMLRLSKEL
ncbi:GNAT family N-acetyltransferase [Gracilibacillus oryzae]|uniref:GNAT family N-acetyltransferase n=1 Tax=Gracilibacillus oryzae TaxID=1672701 RepID=A0A7C8KZD6_9BACI|nr:GNAT family N-acetyltransferase [Gracilibacillus oryzae]KAB8137974.1 GNAT family N-acetyltransferase [Gracilibacillus oryzae]